MAIHKWSDVKSKNLTPERRERIDKDVRNELMAMQLRELRELSNKTQAEVADLASMTQAELSRIERREDHLVSTLRRYVEALGGTVEIVAVIENKRVTLTGV